MNAENYMLSKIENHNIVQSDDSLSKDEEMLYAVYGVLDNYDNNTFKGIYGQLNPYEDSSSITVQLPGSEIKMVPGEIKKIAISAWQNRKNNEPNQQYSAYNEENDTSEIQKTDGNCSSNNSMVQVLCWIILISVLLYASKLVREKAI